LHYSSSTASYTDGDVYSKLLPTAFLKALAWLAKHYHIKHIHISGYNSRANGLVEQSYIDVQQALFKACDREENKWSSSAYLVFWAE
jgi:hypothetical protein